MKELDLKLTLGMAERRLTESPPDEESWGGGSADIIAFSHIPAIDDALTFE